MNSPRSIEALRKLGILESDLFYQDFYTFKANNPQIAVMPREIQVLRYEHHEATRQEYIEAAKKERNKIDDENYPALSVSHVKLLNIYRIKVNLKMMRLAKILQF